MKNKIDRPYVLRKEGKEGTLYLRHNHINVNSILAAGLYSSSYARRYAEDHKDFSAIPVTDIFMNIGMVENQIECLEAIKEAIMDVVNNGE